MFYKVTFYVLKLCKACWKHSILCFTYKKSMLETLHFMLKHVYLFYAARNKVTLTVI
jgi:hypothetical protein